MLANNAVINAKDALIQVQIVHHVLIQLELEFLIAIAQINYFMIMALLLNVKSVCINVSLAMPEIIVHLVK